MNDMNTIFKYNANAKYLAKDLRGGHNSNNFSLLDVYLDEKGLSLRIQLPNILKDYNIDEWPLSFSIWTKFYNSHGKYKPESNEYFHMY